MSLKVPKTALVDTGFWYALLDVRDQHHIEAQTKVDSLYRLQYLVPWPVMYETLCTRFARRPLALHSFEKFLKRPNAIQVNDSQYRTDALALTFSTKRTPALSLVDHVLRMIIDDANLMIDCLYTFNANDFRDVCQRKQVEII